MAPDPSTGVSKANSLKQQRATARSNITRIKKMLDVSTTTWNVIDLECRLEILNSYIKQIMAYQTEIEKEDPSDDKRGDIEELCISCKTKLMQLLGDYKRRDSSILENTLGSSMQPSSRLPKLKLPNFDGKYADYKNFMSSFNSLVHTEPHLATIEKFNHLLSCLSGDALRTVKAFQVTEDNYSKVLERLAERYDKKALIFFDNVEKLFQIPKLVKPNASALRNAVDTVSAVYDSLRSLGTEGEITNALIIHLIISKVDPGTKSKWNDHLDYSTLPSWDACMKLLIRRCQSLEVNEDRSSKLDADTAHATNRSNPNKANKFNNTKHDNKASFTVANASNNNNCIYCKQNSHTINTCNTFASLPVSNRFDFIKKGGYCINCLKSGHSVRNCKSSLCRICRRSHHSLLHVYKPNGNSNNTLPSTSPTSVAVATSAPQQQSNQSSSHHVTSTNDVVVLATAMVKIKDRFGKTQVVRALLDSGSQVNFMSEECAHNLQLKRQYRDLNLSGIGELSSRLRHKVSTTVQSRFTAFEFQAEFWVINTISGYQPETSLAIESWQIPRNIELADSRFNKSQKIDLLIGADIFFELLSVGQIKLSDSLPTLQKTLLGWIVSGRYKSVETPEKSSCNLVHKESEIQLTSIDEYVRKFWEIEEGPMVSKKIPKEHNDCEAHFVNHIKQLSNGRFEVRLPFKKSPHSLGLSYETAKRRFLSLERRLLKTPNLHEMYNEFMREYLSLGHMSQTDNSIPTGPHYFIPHQVVLRPDSLTTKLRVVFDASCKTSSNISLNDILMVGPTIQPDLYITLLNFRCRKFAITADICKMYRQVLIHESDRQFQLILWRESPSLPVNIYKLNTVTYGTSPAPFLAIRCLNELGIRNNDNMPTGAKIIQEHFYVDDLLSGADTIDELEEIKSEVLKILDSGGFKLAKWYSNCQYLNNANSNEKSITFNDTEKTKTLGIVWHPREDTLQFNLVAELNCLKATKRNILSASSRLFDPLGLLCPVITKAKLLLQELWLQKLDWDESVPIGVATSWECFKTNFQTISAIKVPRYVNVSPTSKVQVHGFADASMRTYGCCIYIRSRCHDKYKTMLYTAKSKVAPLKTKTLPRLELCAAHLLARLWQSIAPTLISHTEKVVFWSDSEIVLYWLKKHPSSLSTFVSNRVAEIQEWSNNAIWRHVPSAHNPADIVSRSCNVDELQQSMWFEGPKFLESDEINWPINENFEPPENLKSSELRKSKIVALAVKQEDSIINEVIRNCSSYSKILRVIAYIYRFIKYDAKVNNAKLEITSKELELAFLKIVETIQHEEYSEVIKAVENSASLPKQMQKLSPFMHEYEIDGRKFILLRVGGRLAHAPLDYNTRHPLLMPKSRFVYLYATYLHLSNCHAGPKVLLGLMRLRIWSINAREVARKVVRDCVHCFRYKPKLLTQIMGNLPKDRLLSVRPFLITGVDFCGPVYTSYRIRGKPPYKTYIAVFVCFSSKAVHLEAVSDLTSNSFISCLKRFVGRRGLPQKVVCDNATNFVGAEAKLRELHEMFFSEAKQGRILEFAADQGIKFEFIPPRAPHFGGLWEAAVKSMKNLLRRTVANANLTFEELTTVLVEVEAVLNSRPIAPMTEDPNDGEALTPAHLLIGCALKAVPEPSADEDNPPYSRRWKRISSLKGRFWCTFRREYLLELQTRAKWCKPQRNVGVGSMVIVHEDNLPPQNWLLGRVVEVVLGTDGMVRVACIKTRNGVIRRAIHKLALLPMD